MKNSFFNSTVLVALLFGVAASVVSCSDPLEETEPKLDAPTYMLENDLTATSARLEWNAVADATGYEVIFDGGGVIPVAETYYPVSGLDPATEYEWQVRTVKGEQRSAWNKATFKTEDRIPAPTNLREDVTIIGVTVMWDPVDGATGYQVRVEDGEPKDAGVETMLDLWDLEPATTYKWSVRAMKGEDAGEWATEDEFTTHVALTPDPDLAGTYDASGYKFTLTGGKLVEPEARNWVQRIDRVIDLTGSLPAETYAIYGAFEWNIDDKLLPLLIEKDGDRLYLLNGMAYPVGPHPTLAPDGEFASFSDLFLISDQGALAGHPTEKRICEIEWDREGGTLVFPETINGSDYVLTILGIDQRVTPINPQTVTGYWNRFSMTKQAE